MSSWRSIVVSAVLGLTIATGAFADKHGWSDADSAAIRTAISEQISAFKRNDGAAAFAFASPTIQRMFGSPAAFIDMVKSSYPPVYSPREVEFRKAVDLKTHIKQEVLVVGPDGQPHVAEYFMQRQPDGTWRIDGCMLVAAPKDRST
jgi:Domain of unknown function (DUF4864)